MAWRFLEFIHHRPRNPAPNAQNLRKWAKNRSVKARIPVAANKEMTPDQHLRRFELREAS